MKISDLEIGKWYTAMYGHYDCVVTGQCVGIGDDIIVLRSFYDNPIRTEKAIMPHKVIAEANDPRWIPRLIEMCKDKSPEEDKEKNKE
jgi:hypothetical protein